MDPILWLLVLFIFSLAIGILAPLAGVGGGVLFVPLSAAIFPFNIDFIRGAGLALALTSALSSSPKLMEEGLANLKASIVIAVVSVASAIAGSIIGLWVTNKIPQGKYYIYLTLGIVILLIFLVMLKGRVEFPEVKKVDSLSQKLGLYGSWYEPSLGKVVEYKFTRTLHSIPAFIGVGLIAGMFGLGAGWANVPVLNLLMCAPIKVAVSTSMAIIALNTSAALWIYIIKGAVLPLIVIPTVIGMTIGSRIGAMLTVKARPRVIRIIVLVILLVSALVNIHKGLHGLGMV